MSTWALSVPSIRSVQSSWQSVTSQDLLNWKHATGEMATRGDGTTSGTSTEPPQGGEVATVTLSMTELQATVEALVKKALDKHRSGPPTDGGKRTLGCNTQSLPGDPIPWDDQGNSRGVAQ